MDKTFDDLGLSPELLAAIKAKGYTKPTPIQEQAIPHVLARKDVLGIAQTGTGKTASFCLPMIDRLSKGRARARMPRTLILEPTRELAAQVAEAFDLYGTNHKLSVALLIGGVSFGDQDAKLGRGVDVLIATPGRLLDHFERGKLLLTGVEMFVVDEADRMLDMGFIPDVERICKLLPFTRQTLFFSATMPPEIQRLVDTFLHSPVRIEVARPATTAATVEQLLFRTTTEMKREALRRLIRQENVKNAIIFCNRKRDVAILDASLRKHGFNAGALHGDMDQRARMATLDSFRKGDLQLLVASDVAARGLDIPDVSHVFNFDVPIHADDYVHRIGRTGRAGKSGRALTLCTRSEGKALAAIESLTGRALSEITVEDMPQPAEAAEGAEDARPSRGRNRRSGKDRDRRPAAPARDPKPEAAAATPEPAPARQQPSQRKPAPRSRDRQRDEEHDKPVVGLGDHVPAFLLRTTRTTDPVDA